MTATVDQAKYPEHVHHPDLRVQAVLILAQFAVDCIPTPTPLADAALAIVPHVTATQPHDMARRQFGMIVADLEDATDYDTRGAEKVREGFGSWNPVVGLTADEKASEMRDELRSTARQAAEWLVELDDRLAARS